MIAIAMTAMFHMGTSFASTQLDSATSFATQDDDQSSNAKISSDLCNFCSGTAAVTDVATPSSVHAVRQLVPSGVARNLIAFQLPTTAPPPRS